MISLRRIDHLVRLCFANILDLLRFFFCLGNIFPLHECDEKQARYRSLEY